MSKLSETAQKLHNQVSSRDAHSNKVRLLLNNSNAEINSVTEKERTPLMRTIKHGHNPKTVSILLKHNANLNMQDKDGMTALMFAAKEGHYDIALTLIAKKADLNLQNKNNQTVLDIVTASKSKWSLLHSQPSTREELLSRLKSCNAKTGTQLRTEQDLPRANQIRHEQSSRENSTNSRG
jgi:hypothetical protein